MHVASFDGRDLMGLTRTTGIGLAGIILLSLLAGGEMSLSADAAQPTRKQALADCKAKYGKKVAKAIVNKNGSVTCKWWVRPTQKQALAGCKAKYGKNVVSVTINKKGTVICHTQVTRQMTRAEVFEACRKKYGATTIIIEKKKSGWLCRYYGRY